MFFKDKHKEIKEKLDQFLSLNYIEPFSQLECEPSFLQGNMRNASPDIPRSACVSYSKRAASDMDSFLENTFDENGVAKKLNLYMYERDITTAMIYERCFVDRRLISKITSQSNYHPSKSTMLALCIGLQLNLQEGEEFLNLAGYSFSNTSKFDLMIKFFLQNEIYDLDTINDLLYQYHQPCLGA